VQVQAEVVCQAIPQQCQVQGALPNSCFQRWGILQYQGVVLVVREAAAVLRVQGAVQLHAQPLLL
jgi:hypothetical protein